jgi:hypothetical protein
MGLSRGGLEGAGVDDPAERIWRARSALDRLITDRFGADPGLMNAAQEISISAAEAVDILRMDDGTEPSHDGLGALEAVVAFDGTRPSFLVKQSNIDFDSSLNSTAWQTDLKPYREQIAAHIACTARVELGEKHIGTAFLVTPDLVITNRHVAQAIASLTDPRMTLRSGVAIDFGREEWNERKSFDRRAVESVAFAGASAIGAPLDHRKLDLAVLRVSRSLLSGALGARHIDSSPIDRDAFSAAPFVATAGYPSNAELVVPGPIRSKFGEVLRRLLEGDGGVKRFAPGVPVGSDGVPNGAPWTICHDATTIKGNSGSPLMTLISGAGASVNLAGLHYGGDWDGERVNWAHLLSAVGNAAGYGTAVTFAEFCKAQGIRL